jgi:hypothetical protein
MKSVRVRAAGRAGRRFAAALGIGRGALTARVTEVLGFDDPSIALRLRTGGGRSLTVILKPVSSGETGLAKTKDILIQYEGRSLAPADEVLLHRVRRNIEGATFLDLWHDLERAAAATEPEKIPVPETGVDEAEARPGRAGDAAAGTRFFFSHVFARNFLTSLRVDLPVCCLTHGDLECRFATPRIDGRTLSIFAYPWVRPLARRPPGSPEAFEALALEESRRLFTDLRDVDVVMGGGKVLDSALRVLEKESGGLGAMVVRMTCVPHVTGDDAAGCAAKWRGSCPIYIDDPIGGTENNSTIELVRPALHAASGERGNTDGGAALIGFPENEGTRELCSILEEAGLHVVSRFIPAVSIDEARRCATASLLVFMPQPHYGELYEKLFEGLSIPSITPDPAYGLEGSRRWCDAVGRAAGKAAAVRAAWKRRLASQAAEWDALRSRAGKLRLGIAGSLEEIEGLADPARMSGVPLAAVLREMGFGLDLFLFTNGRDPDRVELPAPLEACSPVLHRVGSLEELHAAFRASACRAVYSDLVFDERITRAGKTPFSLQIFDPGPAGALRALQRLVDACELDFFERYAPWLEGAEGRHG